MNIYTSFQATKDQSNNGMEPTFQKTEYNQANNLCRCTGYVGIVEAVLEGASFRAQANGGQHA